ncbi:hypothetical protein H2200_010389 [Cladophialophora chaetospira]|uniref:Cytochrome P450 n=1 Tax=Cladophialophora chaetospira TaxID=386627 RepID=A0AA39CE37_9EURO|nr:hypothetical protein H2200_010389 [Cladophialophora chaetospira]
MIWYILLLAVVVGLYSFSKRNRQWPDGPGGLPFIGVLPDKNLKLYEQFASLARRYGDFFSLSMGRSRLIVLSSPTAINELFVKKGGKYSSRPAASAQAKIIGRDRLIAMEYGDQFRKHRKVAHSLLGMHNSKIFLPYQEYESRQTLKNLLDHPGMFYSEVARYSTSVTFSLLIGARMPRSDGKIPEAMRVMFEDMFKKLRPGYWWADWIPGLNHLPDALAPWRAVAQKSFDNNLDFWSVFYDGIEARTKSGTAPECFLKHLIESPDRASFSHTEQQVMLASLLTAGAETTATALQWLFRAAVLNPAFVKAAQEELGQVVGPDRMPTWTDRPNLPYLNAIIEELHRYASVAPLGVLHATSEADVYRNKTIPAKTTVISNLYDIHHNDEYYRNSSLFLPERFLPEKDSRYAPGLAHAPMHFAFGVGRRECPGKHVADASLFIVISRLLWAFDIKPDPKAPPSNKISGGYPVIRPVPFTCIITPRSAKAAEIIRAEAETKDSSLEVEDASQYEEGLLKVLEKQKAAMR